MLILDIESGLLLVILGILLDLLELLVGDVFVVWSDYVMKIDMEKEFLFFKVFDIYYVVIWLFYLDVLKVMLFVEIVWCQ